MLTEAMNAFNPCLAVLISKGYRITAEFPDDKPADWFAESNQVKLAASSPIALLGLAALWEVRGDSWQKKPEEPDYYDQLLEGGSIPT